MFPDVPRAPRSGWRLREALLLLALLLLPRASAAQEPDRIPVGMNLRTLTPYDRSWVFADAMKLAAPWRLLGQERTKPVRRARDVDEVPVDGDGWPRPAQGEAVYTRVFTSMRGRFPAGEYVLRWSGGGTFRFRGAVRVLSQEPNRIVLDVDPWSGGAIEVQLHDFDPDEPTREVHLWLPGLEGSSSAFHPLFLERLRPFQVLRFYNWLRVYTTSGEWSERSQVSSARQTTPQGVAVEHMVELCNTLGSDPWFCMPHTADDDYVRRFATLVRDTLSPGRRVYVEYSNEVWNTDFAAGRWTRERARQRGVQAGLVVAEEAARVFRIWREVFAEGAGRLVRVVGGHLHNPAFARSVCKGLGDELDAIAVGAYFSARADRSDVDRTSTAEQLMAAAAENLEQLVLPRISDHAALAQELSERLGRHIALVAYEGGPSIVARSPGGGLDLQATLECQDLPEMYTAYRHLLEEGRVRGLELFVGYDFAGVRDEADTFSVLEYLEQPTASAPKYRALVEGWESRNL
jgi:hypothetical protein